APGDAARADGRGQGETDLAAPPAAVLRRPRAAGRADPPLPAPLLEPRDPDDLHGALGRLPRHLALEVDARRLEAATRRARRARRPAARRDRPDRARGRRVDPVPAVGASRPSAPRDRAPAARRPPR